MTQMTAEDAQTINDIFEKYDIQKFYPAYISTPTKPCMPVFLPEKLDALTEAVVLIRKAPDPSLKNPKFNIAINDWEETSTDALSVQLSNLAEQFKTLNATVASNTDSKEIGQIKEVLTSLTQMALSAGNAPAQSVAPKAPKEVILMNSLLEQLLIIQYKDWHTLSLGTLQYDVKIGAITADSYKRITGEDYAEKTN